MITKDLDVSTASRTQMLDITSKVGAYVEQSGVAEGLCMVYIPHTTASVVINEGWDPAVAHDITSHLDKMVPWSAGYSHSEGNSAAHIKASLIGHSAQIAIRGGKLRLGTWQAIFFCEFDGPRRRKVQVNILEG